MDDLDAVTRLPDDFDGQVRLFPLPDLVLFPHAMQPLHIFERVAGPPARLRSMSRSGNAGVSGQRVHQLEFCLRPSLVPLVGGPC